RNRGGSWGCWRITAPPYFRSGTFDDLKSGSREVDGVDAAVPRAAPAVVTELRPQPSAAIPGACRRTGTEGGRNAPPVTRDAEHRAKNHRAIATGGRIGLRSQRCRFLAVDAGCAVPFPIGRESTNGSGGDSPTDWRLEPGQTNRS